ncbi:unnamed protein product [Parajaminaea phylloscopi]
MAVATASALLPNSISLSMTRPHATTDSRLLQNLIKAEKGYTTQLAATVTSSQAAAAALKAWGTSEARDVASTSSHLADLLSDVADAQGNHLEAIRGYREALKDVADREASIRTIVRDRDILVSRLIKASKKNGDVPHAQRELTACEEVLEAEERALVGVKRRTFKEALSMRMKLMGDAGSRMIECAKEAILLLDSFDQHADPNGRRPSREDDEYDGQLQHAMHSEGYYHAHDPSYEAQQQAQDFHFPQQPDHGTALDVPSHDFGNFNALENASVTPSQSASQAAYGQRLSQQLTGGPYQRPAFEDGVPHESAEDRADSDASSEADAPLQTQSHNNVHGQFEGEQPSARYGSSDPAPTPPSKDYQHSPQHGFASQQHNASLQSHQQQNPSHLQSSAGQPQMYSATAPRFNYDGAQLAPIPQAPRLYSRNDAASTSSEEDVRPTTAHQGWSSRPTRRNADDDSSDEEPSREVSRPQRPKAEKRSSFLGKVGRLFKTDMRETNEQQSSHRRSSSIADTVHSTRTAPASNSAVWQTRTDRNLRDSHNESRQALATSHRSSLLRPLAPQAGDDDSSDDEDTRTNLVRVTNTSLPTRASSDVGGSLRRTPSETARVTAGPLSIKQRREQEDRERADVERKAREAVIGAGVGAARPIARSGTIHGSTAAAKTKKKKKKRAPSVAGSEVGTSATRQGGAAARETPAAQRGSSSWVVQGDLSSGNRGLATLVLPSDLAKGDQSKPYPSIMPPTGLPPAASLSRSNSTSTAMGSRPASTMSRSTTKKKKRQSAIAEGPTTGLINRSAKDSGKYTTNSWVPQPQGGQGLAAQAVVAAGVVPHQPAKGQQIAIKQTQGDSSKPKPEPHAALPAPVAMRPSSSQQSTPLKSALKQPSTHRTISPPPASASPLEVTASLGSLPTAPPPATQVLEDVTRPLSVPVAPAAPSLPDVSVSTPPRAASPRPQPVVGQDMNFDGSGRLDMSRSNSSIDHSQEAHIDAALHETPQRERTALPRLDMPESEPFNISFRREGSAGPSGYPNINGKASDEALLTPGEQAAYHHLLGNVDEEGKPVRTGIPDGARSTLQDPEGVTRIIANRVRVGNAAPNASVGDASGSSNVGDEKRGLSHVDNGETSSSSTLPPHDGRWQSTQPSRTYSSEGRTLHTMRSATASPSRGDNAAPLHGALSNSGSANVTAGTQIPTSDVSNLTVGSSGGAGGADVGRRKSVRLAPDTKLPPDVSSPGATGAQQAHERQVSDGFGGFKLEAVRAPGSSIVNSQGTPSNEADDGRPPTELSRRIAPPPQAPPRLPAKAAERTPLGSERERTGWTTRTDRRLAAGADDSSDDDAGGAEAMAAGEDADAYASARRAMGVASRHWKDALSPASRKSSKKATSGAGGGTPSKQSKRAKNTGYNPEIPLPKGMEVVGRQKASR